MLFGEEGKHTMRRGQRQHKIPEKHELNDQPARMDMAHGTKY